MLTNKKIKKREREVTAVTGRQNLWPESASELYRLSDRRLTAKLVPTFADRGVSHGQYGGSLWP
jgi:hypothetical protein